MIEKLSEAEQQAVNGGNGYHILKDGRVLMYVERDDEWDVFDGWDDASLAMTMSGEILDSFKHVRLSQKEIRDILNAITARYARLR